MSENTAMVSTSALCFFSAPYQKCQSVLQASLINQRSHIKKKKVRLWLVFSNALKVNCDLACFQFSSVFVVSSPRSTNIGQVLAAGPKQKLGKNITAEIYYDPKYRWQRYYDEGFCAHSFCVICLLINTQKLSFELLLLPQSSCCLFLYLKYVFARFCFLACEQDYTKTTQQISTKLGWRIASRPRTDPVTFRCRSR